MHNTMKVFVWNPRHESFVKSGDRTDLPPASKAMIGCVAPFIVILVITGLLIIGLAVSQWLNYDTLNQRGVVTEGQFIDYDTFPDNRGYTLAYTFMVDDNEYQGSFTTMDLQYAQDAVGQTTPVTYDPENPALSRAGTAGSSVGSVAITVVAIVWNLAVLGISVALWRMAGASSRLRKTGQLIFGEILEFEAKEIPSNERMVQINMRYTFHSPKTQATIERLNNRPRLREGFDLDNPPQKGDSVAILYDSDKQFEIL